MGELDEQDREDFYRLKCVQDKKMEAKEQEEKELAIKNEKLKKLKGNTVEDEEAMHGDVFDANDPNKQEQEEDDEDLIF